MSRDSILDDDPEVQRELRQLDGILPEGVDRRSFFKQSLVMVAGGALAGCLGGQSPGAGGTDTEAPAQQQDQDSDDQDSQDQGPQQIGPDRQVMFRNFWKAKPGYSAAFMVQHGPENFMGEGATPPDIQGVGTHDSTRRVSTGKNDLGMTHWSTTVSSFPEGFGALTFGVQNPKTFVGLVHRKDKISDPTNLEGKRVAASGEFETAAFKIWANDKKINYDKIDTSFASENVIGALLGGETESRLDGAWTTINDFPAFQEATQDVELGVEPMYNSIPVYGTNLIVNPDFLKEYRSYVVRFKEAYSRAGKWAVLNPDEAIRIFREDIRPELSSLSMETLRNQMRISVAWTNHTDFIKENGMGWLNPDVAERSTNLFAKQFGVDIKADDFIDWSVQEDAEGASFTDDEWAQIEEFGEPYMSRFSQDL